MKPIEKSYAIEEVKPNWQQCQLIMNLDESRNLPHKLPIVNSKRYLKPNHDNKNQIKNRKMVFDKTTKSVEKPHWWTKLKKLPDYRKESNCGQ